MNTHKPYVALEGIQHGNRFFTTHDGSDPTKSATGETWYRVLGYADTPEEARRILYPTQADEDRALRAYLRKMALQVAGILPIDS